MTATVIGLGAIGREVSLQLAAFGVRRLQLIDGGRVSASTAMHEGYWPRDAGKFKGNVLRSAIECLTETTRVDGFPGRRD